MEPLTLLASSKSLGKSIQNKAQFEEAVTHIGEIQSGLIEKGLELGIAYRVGSVPNLSVSDLHKLAFKHQNVPITLESEIDLVSLVIGNELLSSYIDIAYDLADCYHGPSNIVNERATVRVLYGQYSKDGRVISACVDSLSRNVFLFNEICKKHKVHLLIENIPDDTPHLEDLKEKLKSTLRRYNYGPIQLLVDIGNLTTPVNGFDCMNSTQVIDYLNNNRVLIAGYHLKQTSNGKAVGSLQQPSDLDMQRIMQFIMSKGPHHPIVMEPLASPGYNLDSAFEDARYLVGLAKTSK